MEVRFYGALADAIDRQIELDVDAPCSVAEIRERLVGNHPHAAHMIRRSRACVRSDMVNDSRVVAAPDQVEFLPPVSGG